MDKSFPKWCYTNQPLLANLVAFTVILFCKALSVVRGRTRSRWGNGKRKSAKCSEAEEQALPPSLLLSVTGRCCLRSCKGVGARSHRKEQEQFKLVTIIYSLW